MTQLRTPEERDRALDALHALWSDRPGIVGWLATVDHKRIARRYLVTALVFFVLAGLIAMLMRMQLSEPDNHLIGPERYNQLFTMHGTVMMFLFAVPVMEAVAVYMVPLMLGARTIAFPRLNAFGYWMYLFGGVMIFAAMLLDLGPDAGWTGNVPLSAAAFSPSGRTEVWALMIAFTQVSALCVSVGLVAAILAMRAPGMTLTRMPLFVWAMLVTSVMVMFAMPAVLLASGFLISDRLFGTHFYDAAGGGSALLWQHLFWFFGHPAAYIIFLPALGMISSIVETFARRPIFGYRAMVLALVATGILSLCLWGQHMFATGLPLLGDSVQTAAGMLIALPIGVQVFCWIATLWSGRPILATPLLYVLGFFALFAIGGLTGLMVASAPLDLQLHDTYFVVAHLHYALIGGAVFPLLGAVYFWFPKFTGRMLSESLGRIQFWLFFIGLNVTFFPMHLLGLMGMPRRVYTYAAGLGWSVPNLVASFGTWLIAASMTVFVANVLYALRPIRGGRPAGDNPWNAPDLAWATRSPPPPYNFEATPVVGSLTPLWPLDQPLQVMTGLSGARREALLTTPINAAPATRWGMPDADMWPLWSALAMATLFIGAIFSPWGVVLGAIPVAITLAAWCWPRPSQPAMEGA